MNFLSVLYAKAGITVDGVTALNNTATALTPTTSDNSTKIATTAFVKNQNYYPYPTGTTAQYVRGDGSLATLPSIAAEAQRLITEVYNETGATLTKGTVVYINGGHGNLPTVTKALATSDATSAQTYGVVQNDITDNNNGFVVVIGSITDIPTNTYLNGTILYLSPITAGEWTSTKPYAPQHIVYVGIVTRSHPTQGVVEVRVQNGYEMDELHNVSAQSPANGDILQFNFSTQLWTKTTGNTTAIAEGTNLYFTDARARAAITLTTTGTSGAATYSGGVLNIPQYQAALTNPVTGTGTTNYLPKFTGASALGNSLIFDNGTNVGINTASPLTQLTLNGDLSLFTAKQIRLYNSAKNNWAELSSPLINGDSEIDLKIVTKSGIFYFNPTGSLGIGTTSPANGKLVVKDSGYQYIAEPTDSATYGYLGIGHFTNGTFIGTTAGSNTASDLLRFGTGGTERMRITSAGAVGIGTTDPSPFKLAVNGVIGINGTLGNTLGSLYIDHPGVQSWKIGVSNTNTSTLSIGNDVGGAFANKILNLTNSGNILIGTTTDAGYKLYVNGGGLFNGVVTSYATMDHYARRINSPEGASYVTSTSSVTGAIKIKLPVARNNSSTMMMFTVKIYQYSTGNCHEFQIAGYNYGLGNWYNPSVTDLTDNGSNFNVRFGTDATSDCVWIGETNSGWSYPQVFVTDFQAGYGGQGIEWATGWGISFETSFDTVEQTRLASQVITSRSIGAQSVNYAVSAGTAGALSSMLISQFTNDSGYITSSALSGYLPLSGGTLTGALNGTSASFSSSVTAGGDYFAQINGGIFFAGTGAYNTGVLSTNSGNDLILRAGSATRAYITSGGSLLVGDTVVPGETAWKGTAVFGINGTDKVITGYLISSTNGAVIGGHNSALSAWADLNIAGTNLIFRITQTEMMRLNSGGDLLVGTTSSIWGTANRGIIQLNGVSQALIGLSIGGASKAYLFHQGTNLSVWNVANGYIEFGTNNTTRLTIAAGGDATFTSAVTAGGLLTLNLANGGTNAYHTLNRNSITTENMFKWVTGGVNKWWVGQRSKNSEDGFSIYSAAISDDILYLNPAGTATFYGRVSSAAWTTSGRNYSYEWLEFPNASGLYSQINGAHFYPNTATTFGAWAIQGTRNSYGGLSFTGLTNGSVTLMIHQNSNITGFYNAAYDWQFYWSGGTLYVSKTNYGGGTLATVLDSSNVGSYALPIGGGTITGDLTVNNKVYVGTHGCYFEEVLIGSTYELRVVDSAGNMTVLS